MLSPSTSHGQFSTVVGIAIDAQGNVYAGDPGNKRIQVFDGDGAFKTQITDIGAPAALCISPGTHQYLYSANSNPPNDIDANGEIYRLDDSLTAGWKPPEIAAYRGQHGLHVEKGAWEK